MPDINIKVILIAGGKGTRVVELTGGVLPKSLCRINKYIRKPLVSYQLNELKKAGINNILVIFSEPWQLQLFKENIKIGDIPELNYCFADPETHDHPLSFFNNSLIKDFIKNDDFILTYGDMFYTLDLIKNFLKKSKQNNTSVAVKRTSNSERWVFDGKYINFTEDSTGEIILYEYRDRTNFTIHTPVFFQNRALSVINEELLNNPPRTISLFKKMIDKRQLSVITSDYCINLNMPDDIEKISKTISKYYPV